MKKEKEVFSSAQAVFDIIFSTIPKKAYSKQLKKKMAKRWNWEEEQVVEFLDKLQKKYGRTEAQVNSSNYTEDEVMELFIKYDILPLDKLSIEVKKFYSHYENTNWTYAQGSKRVKISNLSAAIRNWIYRDYSKIRENYKKTDEYNLKVDTEWQEILQKVSSQKKITLKKLNIKYPENLPKAQTLLKDWKDAVKKTDK